VARNSVGLEVGTSAVRIASVGRSRTGAVLERLGRVPLPPGAMVDGELADSAVLTSAVKEVVKLAKPGNRQVRLGVVSQRTVAREVELPWVPKKEFATALPLLAADMLPMPAEDCVLDFMPYEERTEAGDQKILLGLLVAAPEAGVLSVIDAVEAGGLVVKDVTLTPLATLAAVGDALAPGPEAIIDIGHSMTTVTIHMAGPPRFMRVLSRGGRDITSGLAEHLSISEGDAELWKCGLPGLWETMSADDHVATESAVRTAVAELVSDIRTSVDFYRTADGQRVQQAYLVGGAGSTFGLPQILAGVLRVPVTMVTGEFLKPGRSSSVITRDLQRATALTPALGVALGAAA
jgi:type IV pilus assembly protein PilM